MRGECHENGIKSETPWVRNDPAVVIETAEQQLEVEGGWIKKKKKHGEGKK